NQARYASAIDSTAQRIGNLPGQGFSNNLNTGKYDGMNATANITYQVSDAVKLSVAYDKLHIGQGYRSELVADNAYKVTTARCSGKYDWMNATASITYQVSDALNLSVAYDKLHIGEGYRSVLVSDNPYNFTHARVSGKVGRWQYNSIWAYMNDLRYPRVADAQD